MNCKFIQIPCPDCEQLHQQLAEKDELLKNACSRSQFWKDNNDAASKEIEELRAQLARCVDFIQTNIDCNCSREVDPEYNWIGECDLCKFLNSLSETTYLEV